MDDVPRQKLCELIVTYGRSLGDDPRRCEGLLRDLCGEHKREIHVLVNALKERVAVDLLSPSASSLPPEVLLTRLTRRLQDNLGLTEDAAWWAVDSWALALGVIASARQQSTAVDRKSSNESKRGFNKKRETATERISSNTDISTAVLDIGRYAEEIGADLQQQFPTQLRQDLANRLNEACA